MHNAVQLLQIVVRAGTATGLGARRIPADSGHVVEPAQDPAGIFVGSVTAVGGLLTIVN